MTRYEKSCGAVVLHREENGFTVLIEKMRRGHYSIPKGHVEAGESEEETARREIREETGLLVTPHTEFRREISYCSAPGVRKTVVFFIALTDSTETVCQESEVSAIEFLSPSAAYARLTFATDRSVVRDAVAYAEAHFRLPADQPAR